MNNETYRDDRSFECHFFDWLMEKSVKNPSSFENESETVANVNDQSRVEPEEWEELDPLDSEEIYDSDYPSQPFTLGEIPTVKSRFETVLKNRLKAEMERNPPLFPWETKASDFASYPDVIEEQRVPWIAHKQNLRWSVPIPDPVFAQLLSPCQEAIQSSLREGAKLVQVVETLFPGQGEPLNELTHRVMLGWARNPGDVALPEYETATPTQQMLMTLLAAREIIQALTLTCHLNQPAIKQQWLTSAGVLTLEAEYIQQDGQSPSLKVTGHLPDGGHLWLTGSEGEVTAQRSDRGYVRLELVDPQCDRTYRLNVILHNQDQHPLSFAICPQSLQ
ncbi:hypothetical protein ACL6C3_16360 [Capilliphycus salinus ALCB114379]|uniref:hypothetical protein n=1 Tax=Capilliphycus salinus TaxID=2768948 RepID=UPI0039A518E8